MSKKNTWWKKIILEILIPCINTKWSIIVSQVFAIKHLVTINMLYGLHNWQGQGQD